MIKFVYDNALPYLDEDDPGIRQAAALVCCRLCMGDSIHPQASVYSTGIVDEVIDNLVALGIGDSGM